MTVQCFTPREGYRCVGGPLDGQMTVKADGVRQFDVAIAPDLRPFRLLSRDRMAEPVDAHIQSATYTLTRIADGGLIWQCS